jgi:SAM-dependent methyltransferase
VQGIRSNQADLPLPPPGLMARVGQQRAADTKDGNELSVEDWYLSFGSKLAESVVEFLPEDFDLAGARILDFGCGSGRVLRHLAPYGSELWGCDLDRESIEWLQGNLAGTIEAFENPPEPPIDLPGGHFDLILALSVFTHLVEDWSDWLLELHRLIRPGGYAVISFIGSEMAEEMTGETVTEDDIGMNSIGHGRGFERDSGPIIFHSEWWLRAHWGRAFEIVDFKPNRFGRSHPFSQGAVLLQPKEVALEREDLEWPEDGELRELRAQRVNMKQLKAEAARERKRYVNEGRRQAREQAGAAPSLAKEPSGPAGDSAQEPLTPIMVDCVGRGGSTALMQLLRSSPQVRVEGPFPYERRYFTYLHWWARLLERDDWPKELWRNPELARGERFGNALIGPPPWGPDPVLGAMSAAMMRTAWRQYCRRALAGSEGSKERFYAEKSVDTHRLDLDLLGEVRVISLVRDPRDVFVSIDAFNRRRGRDAFGRGDLSEDAFAEALVERYRARVEWVRGLADPWIVRYEDIVADARAVAAVISGRLGIEFDGSELAKLGAPERPEHVTSESVAGSVGRWRTQLEPSIEARIRDGLRAELDFLGYEAE